MEQLAKTSNVLFPVSVWVFVHIINSVIIRPISCFRMSLHSVRLTVDVEFWRQHHERLLTDTASVVKHISRHANANSFHRIAKVSPVCCTQWYGAGYCVLMGHPICRTRTTWMSYCTYYMFRRSSSIETDVKAFHIGIPPYKCLLWVAESPGDLFKIFVAYVTCLHKTEWLRTVTLEC